MRLFLRLQVGCLVLVGACSDKQIAAKAESEAPSPSVAKATAESKVVEKPRPKAKPPAEVRTFDEEIANADLRIAGSKKLAEEQPKSYLNAERVAGDFLDRARLTGDYGDYQLAEEWVAKAFAVNQATNGIGPYQTRAALNYTLHRLDRVDGDFAKSQFGANDNLTLSSQRLFAGNLALQRGKYDDAKRLIDESIELHEGVSNLSSKAYLVLGFGQVEESEALYKKAMTLYHGSSREPAAWLHLQLGLSDLGRGKYDEALAHYRDAEGKLKGYWLIDEHIAEILTLTGKVEEAKALYLDIIRRTNNPEFMDAMAGILIEAGKTAEAQVYIADAQKRFEDLSAMYPEAAYGHALEHYLEFGDDPAFTIDLAEKNHALRPNADAKVLLTQAYLKGDRTKDAQRIIEEALATPWRTADLLATASEVYAKLGDAAKAEDHLAKAKAINPHVAD